VQQPVWKPVWSPDSKRIAFIGGSDSPETSCNIYVVNVNGSGKPTKFMTLPQACSSTTISTWSPDGNKIAGEMEETIHKKPDRYGFDTFEVPQIYVIDVSGGEDKVQPQKITDGPVEKIQPAWSPNGTEIAFVHYDEIYKMDTDGSGMTRLTHDTDFDLSPSWSPDGKNLAFVRMSRPAANKSEIYTMNSDGSNSTLVRAFVSANPMEWLAW
jgi:Tol biopolymer transport system component